MDLERRCAYCGWIRDHDIDCSKPSLNKRLSLVEQAHLDNLDAFERELSSG
jgi:hypothetical protein